MKTDSMVKLFTCKRIIHHQCFLAYFDKIEPYWSLKADHYLIILLLLMIKKKPTYFRLFIQFIAILCIFPLIFFVIIFHIMLLAWDGKLSLETKEPHGIANEIDNLVIGKIAINRLSLVISTRLLFSLSLWPAQVRKSILLR